MKKTSRSARIKASFAAHKAATAIIAVTCVIGAYGIYHSASTASAATQYVLSPVRLGSITQTVTGTGQVSAENQLDVEPEVSGTITSVAVTVGQRVHKGDLLATIDPSTALTDLQSAKIAYAKFTEPPTQTNLDNAQSAVDKSYTDAWSAISTLFNSVPTPLAGLKDLFYSQDGYLAEQKSTNLTPTGHDYRTVAAAAYDKAAAEYLTALQEYKSSSLSSDHATIEALLAGSSAFADDYSAALKSTQSAVTFISTNQPNYEKGTEATAVSDANSWASDANSEVSSLQSASASIESANNALSDLTKGPDPLDVQSQAISLQQKQDAYDKYFVRAPFDGVVGKIGAKVYDTAGSGTAIATIVSDAKIATISLNEVDAAKVQNGQPVSITFDAIDGLVATGTVSQVDLVGTVSSGVVSYGVKISIATPDNRIKPGMSLNVTITTNQISNVLVVPSSAIKTQGSQSYVQVLSTTATPASATASSTGGLRRGGSGGQSASSTGAFPGSANASSTTLYNASSTRRFGGGFASSTYASYTGSASAAGSGFGGTARTMTVSSATLPQLIVVTVGASDDTNTQILSGLNPGQLVVTRTIAASSAAATAAPSLLSSLGAGGRAGAAGAARAGFGGSAAGTGAARPAATGAARTTTGG